MTKNIFIFPGQGSQAIGMGKDIYDNFAEAKEVFQEVDDALGQNLTDLIFNGTIEDLTLTHNTQPALMAVSIAILRVLEKQSGQILPDLTSYVAGHSLGEYTALCAADALSLSDTAKLLRIRGNAMQDAVPQGQGGMVALIGLDIDAVEDVARKAVASANTSIGGDNILQVANDNSNGQVVLSGTLDAIQAGEEIAKEAGAKRYLPLNVSAPFHSELMLPAADVMRDALADAEINAPSVPLIANVTADIVTSPDEIRQLLVEQMSGRVRWRESIEKLASLEVEQTVEIGAGKVLTGLTRRINKELSAVNISDIAGLEKYLSSCGLTTGSSKN